MTSTVASRPRTSSVRRSASGGTSPAASAAATLTNSSPAAATEASRAVVFTDVAQGREVLDRVRRAGRADIGVPGVERGADRDRAFRRRVAAARARNEFDRRGETSPRMMRSADAAEEEADDLIAHQLVDQAVVVEDRARPDPIELLEIVVERGRREPLAEGRRSADVDEQERHRDLDTRHSGLAELADAVVAEGGIPWAATEPEMLEDGTAGARKRGGTQLAAWFGGEVLERAPEPCQALVLAEQHGSKLAVGGRPRHGATLRRAL